MAMDDAPPLTVAEDVLRLLAPELTRHVHAFLHGGSAGSMASYVNADFHGVSARLRALHAALDEAVLRRRDLYHIAVLAVAVRLQSVILYETTKGLQQC